MPCQMEGMAGRWQREETSFSQKESHCGEIVITFRPIWATFYTFVHKKRGFNLLSPQNF